MLLQSDDCKWCQCQWNNAIVACDIELCDFSLVIVFFSVFVRSVDRLCPLFWLFRFFRVVDFRFSNFLLSCLCHSHLQLDAIVAAIMLLSSKPFVRCDYCFSLVFKRLCYLIPNGCYCRFEAIEPFGFRLFGALCLLLLLMLRDYRFMTGCWWVDAAAAVGALFFKRDSHFVSIVEHRHHLHAFYVDYPFALVSFRFRCDYFPKNVFPLWWRRTVTVPIQKHHYYSQSNTCK